MERTLLCPTVVYSHHSHSENNLNIQDKNPFGHFTIHHAPNWAQGTFLYAVQLSA